MAENDAPESSGTPPLTKAQLKALEKAGRPWYKKKRFIIPIALVLFASAVSASNNGSGTDNSSASSSSSSENDASSATESEAPVEQKPDVPVEFANALIKH